MRHIFDSAIDYLQPNILVAITICYVAGAATAKCVTISPVTLQQAASALLATFCILLFLYQKKYTYLFALPLYVAM